MLQMLWSQGSNSPQDLQMLQPLREETEGKLETPLSPRKNGLTSLFKEVRAFKVRITYKRQALLSGPLEIFSPAWKF